MNAFFLNELMSDSSDEDENVLLLARGPMDMRPRVQNYIDNVVDEYSNEEFMDNFRMSRTTFEFTFNKIKDEISTHILDRGRHTISPKAQLLVTLWYFGTPDSYRSICGRFNIGKATGLRTVRRVTNALILISPEIIQWPSGDYLEEVKNGFHEMGMPNTIGCIDGMHVQIPKPRLHGQSYINRKKFASVILQGICDHKLKFTHCYAGEVGGNHDSTVLKRSEIWTFINEENVIKFPNDTHLLGDKAYPCLPELITPYRDNGFLTNEQKQFNFLLSRTRITIERTFGLLQNRFRCLKDCLNVRKSEWISKYIIAICVLHNVCIDQNDLLNFEEENNNNEEEEQRNAGYIRQRLLLGRAKRNRLCQLINNQ